MQKNDFSNLSCSDNTTNDKFCSGVLSVNCFGVRVSVMFHFMFDHYTLVQFGLPSGHLLENSCPLG